MLTEHRDQVQVASRLTTTGYLDRLDELGSVQLLDVRNPGEFKLGTIEGAINIPVGELAGRVDEIDPRRPTVVFCAGGYRSSVAASLLRSRGVEDVSDIIGGYGAWTTAVQPV